MDSQPKSPLTTQRDTGPTGKVFEYKVFAQRLSSQPYSAKKWKRSRVQRGFLIRRLSGYSISETEYGVSYLYVLSRKPDKTSADRTLYPLAGFFTWTALEMAGLVIKERNAKSGNQANG